MCSRKLWFLMVLLTVVCPLVDVARQNKNRGGGKHNLRFLKNHRGIGNNVRRNANTTNLGLWPSVFNLATKADIFANATCGTHGREEFCRMSESGKGRCGVCDDFSTDQGKRHPISSAIDGTNRWWQSPALFYGPEFEYVTVTLDLKQTYQIAYIILKAANSPRPGTWILEKSLDGEHFEPWQYFARTDKECTDLFGMPPTKGKPHYSTDSEVICTSFYSKLTPLENGEIHTSLIQGRPGSNETSPELLEFTKARYVRLRFMGLRGNMEPLPKWLSHDIWREKKLFYSIKDISIGGQCVCNGHAENCRHNVASGHPECECQHHTCGPNCEKCCPLYNQRRWYPGSSRDAQKCAPCNCHGHAKSCSYDEDIDRQGLSMNIDGSYQGGGVCENCTKFTAGVNCEKCLNGYYRPTGVLPQDSVPCLKCDCSPVGTADDVCIQYGISAGICKCRPGYTGIKCGSCASGYRGYPNCESCPCDPKGILGNNDCEEECICKSNVEGKNCDRCKPGYFGLNANNPLGCLSCYCSGITTLCELGIIKSTIIQTMENWLITDLKVTQYLTPVTSPTSVFSVGNFELSGIENLYWLAPKEYLSNKLEAYGATFQFNVQWVVMRGDTSGEPTIGPNMILVGQNGLQLGFGDDTYSSQRMSFSIPLDERGWYVIPSEIRDITSRMSRSEYNKGQVTREQFLSVLVNLKHILLRGTYHTDQLEALLEDPVLSYGSDDETSYESGSVEKCSCPSGYTGLSCESCSFGYVRISANSSTDKVLGYCGKCDCNGHSETCNAITGECFCEHDTIGEKCERCAVGFYGNPLRGTVDDCKPCACPLENAENNFSPSCQLDYFNLDNEGGYVCTQCPKGYTGDHCEICDDGFFGDPMEIGNSCKPCDCNGGPCDRKTGQCLACKGNTEGWKCERCKSDHYGDPTTSNCKDCECDPIGSESKQCNNTTGQCKCKEKFVGRTCDQCESGYGNITALCPPCACNSIGSKSGLCDGHTGICECLPGVDGFRCDACQNLHWGFSTNGCQACNCDPFGSKYSSCDPTTGNCICKAHFEGRTCEACKPGYWKTLKNDCIKCHCNEFGSTDSICNQDTGQCKCKPGVTGQNCDQCLPNYYGTAESGCIECEPCNRKGHVCGKGGKCLCPVLTIGKECERCTVNSWGYVPLIGCKACNCSSAGSANLQCDKTTGSCQCKPGYEGTKCDRCAFGFHGYPNCKKCLCNFVGTLETECQNGDCQCNEDGGCNCKENVGGSKCNICKAGTFGLSKENPRGCQECFCFGRSAQCEDTKYNWDKIRFEKIENDIDSNEPISSDTISLPKQFMGDLTTSYDGYLSVNGTGGRFSVFLTGNGISLNSDVSTNELRLNERYFRVTSGNIKTCHTHMNRECFILVLQNVTSVVIQGQDMEIVEVLLDSAKPYIPYNRTSHSIEKCQCSPEYTGLSCQNPNSGYYRYFPQDYEITTHPWIDEVIGIARPCDCNGRSSECDSDTGNCKNCANNTSGTHCELCATGYYQDYLGTCQPCLCPSETDNNAESCVAKKQGFVCHCKKGYTGNKCESCKESYFRDPDTNKCIPCNCNFYGSYSSVCNAYGKCECRSGFEGDKCSQCKDPREFIKNGVCTQCDECTQLLFHDIDHLTNALESVKDIFKEGLVPPWKALDVVRQRYKTYNKTFTYRSNKANDILKNSNVDGLEDRVFTMVDNVDVIGQELDDVLKKTKHKQGEAEEFIGDLNNLDTTLANIITHLKNFGKKHVDVETAMKQAHDVFDEMQNKIRKKVEDEVYYSTPIHDYCKKVSGEVETLYRQPPQLPSGDLDVLNEKLDELDLITRDVEEKNINVEMRNDQNRVAIFKLKDTIDNLTKLSESAEDSLTKIEDTIQSVKDKMSELKTVSQNMEDFDFSEADDLEDKLYDMEEETPALENLVRRASEHAATLKNIVDTRIGMLNFTKDETEKIKTSGAYNEIMETIEEAKKIEHEAENTLQKALDIMYPKDADSLFDKVNLAHGKSDRLKHRIINMRNISSSFNVYKNMVDSLKDSLIDSGAYNNDLNRQLLGLEDQITSKQDLVDKLHETIENSAKVIDKMRNIEKDISELNITIRYDLLNEKNGYDSARVEAEEEIKKATNTVNDAIIKVNQLLENQKQIDDISLREGQMKLDSVTSKIGELQSKILYARQAAESINVAMGLSNCSMLYSLPQAEIFKTLVITFKCANCQLFKWDHGGITIRVKHGRAILNYTIDDQSDEIMTDKEGGTKIEKTLFVQRVGSLLQMKYDNDSSWKTAQIGNKVLLLEPTDHFQVGDGRPAQNNAYIYKFSINDNNVGLWKFAQTSGKCKGQARVDFRELTGAKPFYSGYGYKKFGTAPLAPAKFNLPFYFATFDENSLLYMAQENDNPAAFIALTLEEGHLRLDVIHNNGKSIIIKTKDRFNDGKTYSADITMTYSNRIQSYSLETDKNKDSTRMQLDNRAVFRIKKAVHYVGGLPPTLNSSAININTRSFLGYLTPRAQLSNELISSGVTQKVGDLELYKAWFNGNGSLYVVADLSIAGKLTSIAFILRPMNANAAIMDIEGFGTITLSNRLIQFNLVNGEHYLSDRRLALDINDYNVVYLTFTSDRISLTVNDEDEIIYRLKSGYILEGRSLTMTIGSTEGFASLYGGISEISINDVKLPFTSKSVTGFANVDIGREPPLIRPTITLKGLISPSYVSNMTNTMQNTQGCAVIANYITDPTAVNFGDQPNSYMKIKTGFWKKDFKFEFDFRTFYLDGTLFISVGSTSPPQYNLLELKDGKVLFHVKGKRAKTPKNWPISFDKKVNDGQWHTIKLIKKNGKKLQMSLDDEVKKPVRIQKTAVKNEMFMGSVPGDYIANKELRDRVKPFRGCINNVKINDETKLFGKNNNDVVYSNIRQCFPKIEQGAYFGGDAYAIYKEGFRVNKILDLSFDFRTAEQNGILMSVSNEGNYPALSVELQNGAVVMTIDLGNGIQSNVTNNLNSDFALCNNMWHSVNAMYSSSELTVNVDGIRKSWVQSDVNSLMDEIDAPLYIGGLPDNAAIGTVKTRENFKGCIKNMIIENDLKEWTSMEELNNVLLNSCPVVPAKS